MSDIQKAVDRNDEWRITKKLLQGLYPKWQTSDEQIDTWKEAFGMYNPVWFRDAIKLMYRKYSGENPKPKWVDECFKEVRAGYRGISLDEGTSQSMKFQEDQRILAQQEKDVADDRIRAWNNVSKWENEERISWADLFTERFPNLASTNDSSDMSTWSKTFCQFVFVFRRMKIKQEQEQQKQKPNEPEVQSEFVMHDGLMDGVGMMPLE